MQFLKKITLLAYGVTFSLVASAASDHFTPVPSFYDALPAVKKGGTLNLTLASDPKVINPLLSTDAFSVSLEGYLWVPLMTMDPETLNYLPLLATSYSISNDKKDYTFSLNPLAKWQDGTSVTAQDIKFTFDKIMDPSVNSAVMRSYLSGITLEQKDNSTVVFHVKDPKFDTLFMLCGFVSIQKKQFEHSKKFNDDPGILHPVGNGPYVLSQYERGNKITFARNKTWWAYSLPHMKAKYNIDNVTIKIISDTNLAYEKFIHQDIDNVTLTEEQWHTKVMGLDKDKFSFTSTKNKKLWGLKVENKFPKPYSFIGWNEKNVIFNSVKTRTALSYLVNYKKIMERVFFNLQIQSTSPFGSFTKNSAPELRGAEKMISFNKAKAMSLLKEDGWTNGGKGNLVKKIDGKLTPFVFDFAVPTQSQNSLKIAQILKEDFKASGITLNIKSLEWNSFLDKIEKRDFDALILSWTSTLFPNAKQTWDSRSMNASNFIGYKNSIVDDLIAKSNLEFDPLKRNSLLQEINRLIYADQPYTFLFEPKYVLEGLNTRIKSPKWVSQYEGGSAFELFYLN